MDVDVDPALVAEVRRFAAKQQVTFVAAMLAGAAATVSRLCGEDDVVLALPSAGQATLGMPGLVGHCVNVLPVRLYVDAQESVGALVRRAGTRLLDVQEHARFTLGRLLRTVALPRVPGRIPVTPVMFNVDQGLKLDTLLAGTALRGEVRTIPRVAGGAAASDGPCHSPSSRARVAGGIASSAAAGRSASATIDARSAT